MSSQVQNIDFQGLLQATVQDVVGFWAQQDMPEDLIGEYSQTLFQMGTIAVQQMQENTQIQIENAPDPIDVTPELAQMVVQEFVWGLQEAYIQSFKMGVPPQETMELIQATALYVFEQTKNIAVAAIGQQMAGQPMPDDQVRQYLTQTAGGAFGHYLSELEKQRGPIAGTADFVAGVDQAQGAYQEQFDAQQDDSEAQVESQDDFLTEELGPEPESVVQHVPEQVVLAPEPEQPSAKAYHKVALGLLLSSLPIEKRHEVRQLFLDIPDAEIQDFRGLQDVPRDMNTAQLLETIRQLKTTVKQRLKAQPKNARYYHEKVGKLVTQQSYEQVKGLFVSERVGLEHYVDQFVVMGPKAITKPEKLLPQGVLKSLMQYLKKHLPQSS